jgi:hypothetical protein
MLAELDDNRCLQEVLFGHGSQGGVHGMAGNWGQIRGVLARNADAVFFKQTLCTVKTFRGELVVSKRAQQLAHLQFLYPWPSVWLYLKQKASLA